MLTEREGMTHSDVLRAIGVCGVVPVVELPTVESGRPLLEALMEGGLPLVEITMRTSAAAEAIGLLRDELADALVGAGTVRSSDDLARVLAAGAQFVVAPGLNLELVAECRRAGVLVLPGVCTPTEVDAAVRAGVTTMKFFPAEAVGGVGFLRALASPFQEVRFIPTGGISEKNLRAYLELPCVGACGGSWIADSALIRDGEFATIAARARAAATIVKDVRDAAA